MDPLNDIGTRDGENVIVALQVLPVIFESLTPEVFLSQGVTLDHRSHRTVEQCDPAGEKLPQKSVRFVIGKGRGHQTCGITDWREGQLMLQVASDGIH